MLLWWHIAARAVTYDEMPAELRQRLPEFVLSVVDQEALKMLSVADLEEYADAYDAGELRFVAELRAVEHAGPVTPELASLILQVPPGAPFIEERFIRLARQAYGQQLFSRLEWQVFENSDGSVNVDLYYSSRDPSFWAPDISYDSLGGWLVGARYMDLYHGMRNRQLEYGLQLSENDTSEPRLYASYTDKTLEGGRRALSVAASVSNDWRTRLRDSDAAAELRQRTARLDLSHSWRGKELGGLPGDLSLGGGVYSQDYYQYAGDPAAGGTAPRGELDQAGTAAYLRLGWDSQKRDMEFTPREGWDYRLGLEQHFGDYVFYRVSADLRRYIPLNSPLGIEHPVVGPGGRHDVRWEFPTASLGLQLRVSAAAGDVPFSQELRLGSADTVRGYSYDSHVATKLLAARAEYRFTLDQARRNEAFIFTDHALAGEEFSDLEAFDSVGLGTIVTVPVYGGVKLGGYYARALDGDDSSYGLALGYQF